MKKNEKQGFFREKMKKNDSFQKNEKKMKFLQKMKKNEKNEKK